MQGMGTETSKSHGLKLVCVAANVFVAGVSFIKTQSGCEGLGIDCLGIR